MGIPIVTTPARTHLLQGTTSQVGQFIIGRTVCGKALESDGFAHGVHFGTHESGDLAASITCKNCRRTITPSVVVFADEQVAVVGPGQAVAPAAAVVVPASPEVGLRYEDGLWILEIDFSDPDSDPAIVINGIDAQVIL